MAQKKHNKRKKTDKKNPIHYLYVSLVLVAVLFGWSGIWHFFENKSDRILPLAENIWKGCKDESERNGTDDKAEVSTVQGMGGLELPARLTDKPEIILSREAYTSSYNTETLCPNYVAWHLTAERVEGNAVRKNNFHGDADIPEKYRVETSDYSRSGYDRGHMCPAGDCKSSDEVMSESFLMTNMCPQGHNLNAGDWKELEDQCREWASSYGEVFVVCGPIFDSARPKTIGKRKGYKISVPDRFFKVVLMMGRVPKAIGFIYPNDDTNLDIRDYAVSVDDVERMTGIDFYPALPDDIESRIEAECNPGAWGI
ncbi:MAG: DNA/RNA non-specific endonuclease [Bacteroides sp.]|nr:DNA/RNA non-specific endonuclease [Roseburia sp.]MCM1347288.1 DNA/RNA non-specific endonuclease [Bacteroides sp.]MCM1421775.1 DNA/RNA non-specific endonuclease [Bacteroides sp.]